MTTAQDIIAAHLAAFNRGDWPGMLALLADDVAHDINQGATQHGKPAFAAFLDHMARCYREELRDIVIMVG
ncbi:MAG: isopropylmalate/homocitrate/citramalate synthase, partial [Acetobacteraceae bacterium]|nr:isopropylmalate/homocitrate/citramalate synthase [Acetobacteraceae bacterium]